jgi:hypothetical protein
MTLHVASPALNLLRPGLGSLVISRAATALIPHVCDLGSFGSEAERLPLPAPSIRNKGWPSFNDLGGVDSVVASKFRYALSSIPTKGRFVFVTECFKEIDSAAPAIASMIVLNVPPTTVAPLNASAGAS